MSGKLFLGGISPNTDEQIIRDHFEKYGTVIDSVVMVKDGKHRGFGFVTFDDPASAQEVLSEEQVIDGRTVDVKEAVPKGEAPEPLAIREPYGGNGFDRQARGGGDRSGGGGRPGPKTDKVFVGGLTQTTTEDQLRDYFAQYGNLIDVVVMKDRASQRSRGFGFVQYDDTEPVDKVMAEYASHQLDGKWVEVKRAEPKDRMAPTPSHSSQRSHYGGRSGSSGPPGPSSQYNPYGGFPPHPYGGYGMQYGYYPPPPGYSPYGAYDPYFAAPGGGPPPSAYGPPPGAYAAGGGGDSRSRPY